MYACAKALAKGIIRGALTDGAEWIFLVLAINDNGDGAKYWLFRGISVLTKFPPCEVKVMAPWPGVVAGILARWMKSSFADIVDGDDWFEVDNVETRDV